MEVKSMRVTSKLGKLALWYDYTIVCKDIRSTIISHSEPDEYGCEMCQWGFELTSPKEYTRKELLEKYDGKSTVIKWGHTYTEKGEPAMAVVLGDNNDTI